MLPFIFSWNISPIESKVPDRKFTEVPIMNFIPDWESETVNQSGLQTNSSENLCYCAKMRALQEKTVSLKDSFLGKSKSSKKKESSQDEDSDTKVSYQILP